jgi:hypothetical protein
VRHFRVGARRRAERPVLLVCREGLRDMLPLNLHLKRVARRAYFESWPCDLSVPPRLGTSL